MTGRDAGPTRGWTPSGRAAGGAGRRCTFGTGGRAASGTGLAEELCRGFAGGLVGAELLGGGERVGDRDGGAFEGFEGLGSEALGDELLAALFDASVGVEGRGDLGGVHPGFELGEGQLVMVAEFEGGKVGVEEFCEQEGGVGGFGIRGSAFGNRGRGREFLCLVHGAGVIDGLEHGVFEHVGIVWEIGRGVNGSWV